MSLARISRITRLDLGFHFSRPMFWILLFMLGLLAFGLSGGNVRMQSGDTSVGADQQVWLTSEFSNALSLSMTGLLFYTFFVAIAAGGLIPRDEELRVGPILHATKLRPREYIRGKFLGVVLMFLAVLAGHVLLSAFFNHAMPTENAENIRGPFSLLNYLRPAMLLIGPLVIFVAGVSFAVGTVTRNTGLVFVLPLMLFVMCIFVLWDSNLPDWVTPQIDRGLQWIEPSGFRWLNETWINVDLGVDFYNHEPIPYDAPFLLSRLALVLIGLGSALFAENHFARTLRGQAAKAPKRRRGWFGRRAPAAGGEATDRELASFAMTAQRPGFLRTVVDVAKFEFSILVRSPGLYLFAPLIVLQVVMNAAFETGAFGVPMLVTPGLAATMSMGTLTTVLCFLLLFYTTESVVRERTTGIAPIYYGAPAGTAAFLFGKAIANGFVAAVILLAAGVGKSLVMLFQGQVQLSLGPFLLIWGALLVPTIVLWSTYVTALVALTGNRWATYGLGLATLLFTAWKNFMGEVNWVGNWSLWGTMTWTDFGALDPNGMAFLANRLFWISVTMFLLVLTIRFFPRREFDSSRTVNRLRPRPLALGILRLAPVALPGVVIGTFLFLQIDGGFQGPAAERREKEYWGRNLATWMDAETPELAGVELDVTLDPPASYLSVKGTYELVNRSDDVMRRFPMSVGNHFGGLAWTLDGEPFEPEDEARLYVFKLDEPMAPGDTVTVGFEYDARMPHGPTKNGGGLGTFVLESGVVLTSFGANFVPQPLFDPGRGVDEDNAFDPKQFDECHWHGYTRPALGSGARFPVKTTIRGPEAYRYHAVGRKNSETVEDGTRTVEWESDHPVNFFNVVASKEWEVRRGEGVEIWHHPKHTYNLDEMLLALEGSRRFYSEWFYPYPWEDLRVNEFPALAQYAQGFPTNITFSEGIGFLARDEGEVDAAFLVTAHEAAHQWWGNLLMPGEGPGGNVLSEGMAHFSTILLHAELKGDERRQGFCRRIEETYGDQRQVDSERPLVWLDGSRGGDGTATYDKGGWVFYMLHRLMGEEASFAAIGDFIGRYQTIRDFPVLQDFLDVVRSHAPDVEAFDAFVDQWFYDVVVPEYRFEDVERQQDDAGWVVRGTLVNRGTARMAVTVSAERGERFADDDRGPASASVAAGFDAALAAAGGAGEWRTASTVVEIGADESVAFEIRCGFEPERVVADPDVTILMINRDGAELTF